MPAKPSFKVLDSIAVVFIGIGVMAPPNKAGDEAYARNNSEMHDFDLMVIMSQSCFNTKQNFFFNF
jgi:hypothetical protein